MICLACCFAVPTAGCRPVVPYGGGQRWVLVIVRADTGVCPYSWMFVARSPLFTFHFSLRAGAVSGQRGYFCGA